MTLFFRAPNSGAVSTRVEVSSRSNDLSAKGTFIKRFISEQASAKCGLLLLKATRWAFHCSRASPVDWLQTKLANYVLVIVILHLFTACIVSF